MTNNPAGQLDIRTHDELVVDCVTFSNPTLQNNNFINSLADLQLGVTHAVVLSL